MAISNSAQKFIARSRAPRVRIEYDVRFTALRKNRAAVHRDGGAGRSGWKPREELPPVTDRRIPRY